jgi:hypothetical protein
MAQETISKEERVIIEEKIRELAAYDFRYFNNYLTEEEKQKFPFTEEEKQKYINICNFLKEKKILIDKGEFYYSNGRDEQVYYMAYEEEQKKFYGLKEE